MPSQEDTFKDGVRKRDRKCVVSDEVNDAVDFDIWDGVDAVHVFTIYYECISRSWLLQN